MLYIAVESGLCALAQAADDTSDDGEEQDSDRNEGGYEREGESLGKVCNPVILELLRKIAE